MPCNTSDPGSTSLLGFHQKESNHEAIVFLLRRFLLQ